MYKVLNIKCFFLKKTKKIEEKKLKKNKKKP